ncbi:Cut8 six-helix bundle-domain-containing protein [Halteromyces radiatus]|uniref:Cut8 six-helix bundle-domain-containing protein n=1 Tax=Halteromyces radiatus TaxID=101107 RepID=UPI002220967A|nr:Cut8 six-helix bundle-domain-containing protein [Halteromyces radiatus]KAI8092477.1 Cut8 six-helix bundle-domain-containing protein [Halteromyces radiatus]
MMACMKGRKRRYSEDEEMGDALPILSPTRSFVVKHQQRSKNDWKRNKTGLNKRTSSPLNLKLATMEKDKLLQILASLLESQPELKHDIMKYIPPPTIPSAISVLTDMEKKLEASFPYNRNGPRRDQYTFSRVRESLLDLIDTITQYSHHFVSTAIFPTTCFTFLDQVTYFAHRLPTWDKDQHNQPRQDLYNDLALFWKQAVQMTFEKFSQDATFHADTIDSWAKSLAHHNTLSNGLLSEAVYEFNRCLLSSSSTSFNQYDTTTILSPSAFTSPGACHPSPVTALDMTPSPVVGYADLRR